MTTEVESLGAVVAGACDKQIPGICAFPEAKIGALFVYNDSRGKQINVCKKCADHLIKTGEWVLEGGLGFVSKLNSAHRIRFPHFVIGKHVKIRISDGTIVEGVIESVYDEGISVNNGASTAGGHNASVTLAWIDIIQEL